MVLGAFIVLAIATWLVITYPIIGIPAVLVGTGWLLGWFDE